MAGLLAQALGRVPIPGATATVGRADASRPRERPGGAIGSTPSSSPGSATHRPSEPTSGEVDGGCLRTVPTRNSTPRTLKLVTFARAARARSRRDEGAAVRDQDGRTYAAATVTLPSLSLTALQLAVAAVVAAGVAHWQRPRSSPRHPLWTLTGTPQYGTSRECAGARRHSATAGRSAPWSARMSDAAARSEAAPSGLPRRLHLFRRSAQRWQVHAGQRDRGSKIAITSSRPQTTRHVVRGVLHQPDAQLVLVDTPGMHKPKTLLGERLNDLVRETWTEVDVIGLCVPADEAVGPGDRFIAAEIASLRATLVAVVTKTDLVPHQLACPSNCSRYHGSATSPTSCPSPRSPASKLEVLVDVMASHVPVSPQLYPDDMITDEPERVMVAELIREAALEGVRDELPHSIAVVVEEMYPDEGRPDLIRSIRRHLRGTTESEVHRHRRRRARACARSAPVRARIESLLGSRVYLDLHVRVAKEWQRDPKQLRRLGF